MTRREEWITSNFLDLHKIFVVPRRKIKVFSLPWSSPRMRTLRCRQVRTLNSLFPLDCLPPFLLPVLELLPSKTSRSSNLSRKELVSQSTNLYICPLCTDSRIILLSRIRLFGKENHDWGLLCDQSVEEVGHGCKESGHERQSGTNDSHDNGRIQLCRQIVLHFPIERLPLPRHGVSEWRRLWSTRQESWRVDRGLGEEVRRRGSRRSRTFAFFRNHSSVSLPCSTFSLLRD